MNAGEWLPKARRCLAEAGVESAKLESELLAAHLLGVDRSTLLAHPDTELPDLAAKALLERRLGGEPLGYIRGWREFYGRRFIVRPGVLIPRQDTEILVEAALDWLIAGESAEVLDLGTGSGCIAITLKLERPASEVTASDVSGEALVVGAENANALGAIVRFVESDGFSGLNEDRFDLIVSNPPYIGASEDLPREVRDFEPRQALIAGETGLEFYERLAVQAAHHLREGGRLMAEVGYRQAREVVSIFEAAGWNLAEVRKDLSGIERVVVVEPVSVES